MKGDREFERRFEIAKRIQQQTGVRVEAVHPAGPIGVKYVVGWSRVGCSDAADARREAREHARQERQSR